MSLCQDNYPHLWQAFLTSLFLLGYYLFASVIQFFISRRLKVNTTSTEHKPPTTLASTSRPQRNPVIASAEVAANEKKEEKKEEKPKTVTTTSTVPDEKKDEKKDEERTTFRPRRPALSQGTTSSSATLSSTKPKTAVFSTKD